jgi:hypothetical protein
MTAPKKMIPAKKKVAALASDTTKNTEAVESNNTTKGATKVADQAKKIVPKKVIPTKAVKEATPAEDTEEETTAPATPAKKAVPAKKVPAKKAAPVVEEEETEEEEFEGTEEFNDDETAFEPDPEELDNDEDDTDEEGDDTDGEDQEGEDEAETEEEPAPTPTKKPVTPAKKVAPTKATPAKKEPVAKAAPAKKAAPTKATPKVGSAKPAPKAAAPKAPNAAAKKAGGKITVGKKKETKGSNFDINYGGRTTREAFIHQAFLRLEEAGLGFDSKRTLTDVINVIEELLIDVTSVSSFKFMNAMFKLRLNKARNYSVPTTELDTLVPEHYKVLYSRYADPNTEFIYGHYDGDTGIFYPEGEEEGIFVGDITTTKGKASEEGEDEE